MLNVEMEVFLLVGLLWLRRHQTTLTAAFQLYNDAGEELQHAQTGSGLKLSSVQG